MEQIKKEYIFWFFLGIGFIVILAVLTLLAIKSVKSDLPVENSAQKKPAINEEEKPIEPSGNKVIVQESDPKNNLVFYRSGSFIPKEIKVENKDGEGSCIVTIFNDSGGNLEIGLSPHKKEGDQGPRYDLVPSKGNLILDPRFRIPEIAFHNHNLPSAEFKVILGEGCTLD